MNYLDCDPADEPSHSVLRNNPEGATTVGFAVAVLCAACAAGDRSTTKLCSSSRGLFSLSWLRARSGRGIVPDPGKRCSKRLTYCQRGSNGVFAAAPWEFRPGLFHCDPG